MIEEITMKNGIRICLEPMPDFRSVSIGIWINAGSADENPANNGIAHVVEHMLFKGTHKRSAKAIADDITALGGSLDAYTSKETTCYYTRTLGEYAEEALDIMADMLLNSLILEDDLAKEISVILDEIDMYEDDAEELVHELLQKEIWQEHPLGYIISGEKSVVKGFRRQDVLDFMTEYYVGSRMVISVAGGFDKAVLLEKIEALFANIPIGQAREPKAPPFYTKSFLLKQKDIEQMHMDIAFNSIACDHPDKYIFSIVNNILGGNLNSRLFQEIREEKGLAYAVYSYGSSFCNCGLFQIYAACSPESAIAVLAAIGQSIQNMKAHGVSKRELTLTKQQMKAEFIMALESPRGRMESNAKNLIYCEQRETMETVIAQVENITQADIQTFLSHYLDFKQMSLSLVGNTRKLKKKDIENIRRTLEVL